MKIFQARMQREKELELESLQLKLKLLEKEHSECETERQKFQTELGNYRTANSSLNETVDVLRGEFAELTAANERFRSEIHRTQNNSETELKRRDEIIEELQLQLQHVTGR